VPAGAGSFPGKGRDKLMAGKLRYEELPIASIEVSRANVRKTGQHEGLDELARSIKEIGLQQPVVVHQQGDKYSLIIGQRRFLACQKLGMERIPALIRPVSNETEAAIVSFSENIHRLDLNYRDKMRAAIELRKRLKSIAEVAKHLGVTGQTVRNYLGYEGVPEQLKEMVDRGDIGATTAMSIARSVPDEKKAVEIAKKVKEVPSSDRRRSIIDVARENPDRSASEVVGIAKKLRFTKITLNLTPRIAQALETACHDYRHEPEDIANSALEDWLGKRGFLK